MRTFSQVDVFSAEPFLGNPVAVVHDAAGLNDQEMAGFANWTNLSETTFLLPPTTAEADYRLRIFTPSAELRSRGTRRSGRRTRGCRPGECPAATASWSRSAAPGWCGCRQGPDLPSPHRPS